MNKSILHLIIAIIAMVNIIYSFMKVSDTEHFFGIEINIWVYRLIWLGLGALSLLNYLKLKKKV